MVRMSSVCRRLHLGVLLAVIVGRRSAITVIVHVDESDGSAVAAREEIICHADFVQHVVKVRVIALSRYASYS